ncbi:MAG: hypothetical protein EZS28_006058 [Streblomastix strix]|uniref:Uncharacterized protein n=1 Tax=Streblomastix strix TaxID=222440 RepID=A0A5J4WUE3_9EUKA|nr:MAG: hypothetical protein EZS28_006058 [Streblomastix strix]
MKLVTNGVMISKNIKNSANGDFAFSAESGTVWMYETNWYNSGDIVPDQVAPAGDNTPLADSGAGVSGIQNDYAKGDHQHPLQVSTVLPAKDTATGDVGTANIYVRSDHTHLVNLSNSVPKKDTGAGTAGSSNIYARSEHQHPLNIDPSVTNVLLVNVSAVAYGTSDYYCRNDHVIPKQLSNDGNITAIKFIKAGGLATEILCANGETTTKEIMLSRTYSGSGWVRLCVFPADANYGSPFIEFKVYSAYNAVQIIRLQRNFTVNVFTTIYGIFTAPTKMHSSYYSAYIRLETVGTIKTVVTDQNTYSTARIPEKLTQDVVTTVSTETQIPINYDYGYGMEQQQDNGK